MSAAICRKAFQYIRCCIKRQGSRNLAHTFAAGTPRVVLDTNAVLDWLLFADIGIQPAASALEAGQLHWVTCAAMRQELAHMLRHASLARWSPDVATALAHFDRLADLRPAPESNPHTGLHCRDSDDQVFINLALGEGARWLLTHDRALLKLARRAAARGLHIVRPVDWTPQT